MTLIVIFGTQVGLFDAPEIPNRHIRRVVKVGIRTITTCRTQKTILVNYEPRINNAPIIKLERFLVGMPAEYLVPEIHGNNVVLVGAFQIPQVITPHVWARHSMAHKIDQIQVFIKFASTMQV